MRTLLVLATCSAVLTVAPAAWACGMPHPDAEDLAVTMSLLDQLMVPEGEEGVEAVFGLADPSSLKEAFQGRPGLAPPLEPELEPAPVEDVTPPPTPTGPAPGVLS